jgi:mRNA-degrading endonuclease RelE of RelBE toxin-antitoxin system
MPKEITVSGSKEFTKFYLKLQSDNLKKSLDSAMDLLKKNPNAGNMIKTKLWPDKYTKKYKINNLYRFALGSKWRIIYTLVGGDNTIDCAILDVLDHRNYDKIFGYKTS